MQKPSSETWTDYAEAGHQLLKQSTPMPGRRASFHISYWVKKRECGTTDWNSWPGEIVREQSDTSHRIPVILSGGIESLSGMSADRFNAHTPFLFFQRSPFLSSTPKVISPTFFWAVHVSGCYIFSVSVAIKKRSCANTAPCLDG